MPNFHLDRNWYDNPKGMKYLYYAIAIIVFSLMVAWLTTVARGDLEWVRAQYAGAIRCYKVGQEPGSILAKNKRYFHTFEECDNTIGHAL